MENRTSHHYKHKAHNNYECQAYRNRFGTVVIMKVNGEEYLFKTGNSSEEYSKARIDVARNFVNRKDLNFDWHSQYLFNESLRAYPFRLILIILLKK